MDVSRITRMHVFIVGIVVSLLTAAVIYFLFIKDLQQWQTATDAYRDSVVAKADTLPSVQKATLDASAQLQNGNIQDARFWRRNPSFQVDWTKPDQRWIALSLQELEYVRPMQRIQQLLVHPFTQTLPNLHASAVWNFPYPPTTPSQAFAHSPISYPSVGHVRAWGTYPMIQRYLITIGDEAPRLFVIHPVSLDASRAAFATLDPKTYHSPDWVVADFDVSMYEFIKGLPEAPAAPSMGGGAGPGGGSGGGGGGGYPSGGGGAKAGGGSGQNQGQVAGNLVVPPIPSANGQSSGGGGGGSYPGGGGGSAPAAGGYPGGGAARSAPAPAPAGGGKGANRD